MLVPFAAGLLAVSKREKGLEQGGQSRAQDTFQQAPCTGHASALLKHRCSSSSGPSLPSDSPQCPWVPGRQPGAVFLHPRCFQPGIASHRLENPKDAHNPPDMVLVQNRVQQQNIQWGRAGSTQHGCGYGASLPLFSCSVPAALGCSGSAWSLAACSIPNKPMLNTAGLRPRSET